MLLTASTDIGSLICWIALICVYGGDTNMLHLANVLFKIKDIFSYNI